MSVCPAATSIGPAASELTRVWAEAEVPEIVQRYFKNTCSITSSSLFLDYVVCAQMETEWKEILIGAFPANAETGMTAETQRL